MRVWPLIAAASAMSFATMAAAEETRVAPKDYEPPAATLDDVSFLVGRWSGEGIGGAPSHEHWFAPTGPTMVGTFIQEDGEGGIRFTEHLYLMEENGSLVLRLKHFNADLSSWEEKGDTTDFRFISAEPCAAYFSGLTLRCDDAEDGTRGLLAAVRMKSKDGEVSELIFRFKRME